MLSSVIGSIGSLMQGLAIGLVHYVLGCARHPVFIAVQRALAAALASVAGAEFRKAGKLSESPPEDTARPLADQSEESEAVNKESVVSHNDVNHTAQVLTDQGQPPPLSSAEEHGLDAVRAALGSPMQGRPLTRDQVKRLLECLEGR
jgi:predicted lipid-binding transport protein (Tim44 family)